VRKWLLGHWFVKKCTEFGPPITFLPTNLEEVVVCTKKVLPDNLDMTTVYGDVLFFVTERHSVTIRNFPVLGRACSKSMSFQTAEPGRWV
jgi:hypothetical protein